MKMSTVKWGGGGGGGEEGSGTELRKTDLLKAENYDPLLSFGKVYCKWIHYCSPAYSMPVETPHTVFVSLTECHLTPRE